jgi:hypothetical protein
LQPQQQQQQPQHHQWPAAAAAAAVPQPLGAVSDLPNGWYAAVDPTYNTTYYYNPSSGERSWERPAAPLPQGWVEATDPASGHR